MNQPPNQPQDNDSQGSSSGMQGGSSMNYSSSAPANNTVQGQQPQQSAQGQNGKKPVGMQQAQIQLLARRYQLEMQKAHQLGPQTPQGAEHLQTATKIKHVLISYQQQRQRQQGQAQGPGQGQQQGQTQTQGRAPPQTQPQTQGLSPDPTSQQGSPQFQQAHQVMMGTSQSVGTPIAHPQAQSSVSSQVSHMAAPKVNTASPPIPPKTVGTPVGTPGGTPMATQPRGQVTIQQFQQVKSILEEFEKKLRTIEAAKRDQNLPEETLQKLLRQEAILKQRYAQTKATAYQMSQHLQRQQQALRNASAESAEVYSAGTALSPNMNVYNQQIPAQPQQQLQQQQLQQPQPQQPQPARQSPHLSIQQQQQQQQQQHPATHRPSNVSQTMPQVSQPLQSSTPSSAVGRNQSPGATPVTSVNAAAKPSPSTSSTSSLINQHILKPAPPPTEIPTRLQVKPPQPAAMKIPNRPTLLGGSAISQPSLTTPASIRPPPLEMEGDHVLQKRKLKELLRNVGADEGDGETVIDGDVEELLLDLADEFVTSVTSFACRLAKHRKVDNIDMRDVQLHLERNWNIRVPGYASDEIRSVRKFQPTTGYNQKVQGVAISKSVNKN